MSLPAISPFLTGIHRTNQLPVFLLWCTGAVPAWKSDQQFFRLHEAGQTQGPAQADPAWLPSF